MSTHRLSNFARAVGEDMVRMPDGSETHTPQQTTTRGALPTDIDQPPDEDTPGSARISWFEPESQEPWG